MNTRLYLQGVILVFTLMFLYFFIGDLIGRFFRAKTYITVSVAIGFATHLTIFEVMALPFMLLRGRFFPLFVIFLVITALLLGYSLWQFIRKKRHWLYFRGKKGELDQKAEVGADSKRDKMMERRTFREKKRIGKVVDALLLVGIVSVVLFQCLYSSWYLHEDADDSYFVTVSNVAVEQDQVMVEERYVLSGNQLTEEAFRPQVTSWEVYLAVLSRAFGIKPAAMAHSYLPFFLILLCYFVYHMLSLELFKEARRRRVFMLVAGVLNLFGGMCVYTSSMFLLVRIWQGKAMLCNFLFPLLYAVFASIYKKGLTRVYQWISFVGLFVLGVALTPVGLYLVPIAGFVSMVAYIVFMLVERRTGIMKLLKQIVLFMLPLLGVLLFVFYKVISSKDGSSYIQATSTGVEWLPTMKQVYSNWFYPGIFSASSLILLLNWRKQKDKLFLFLGSTVVLFLTFLNPLLCRLVSVYVTGVAVYWRLSWLVPVVLVCGCAAAELAGGAQDEARAISYGVGRVTEKKLNGKKYIRELLLAVDILVLVVAACKWGTYIYKNGLYFTESTGPEKFFPETYAVMDYIAETDGFHGQMLIGPERITSQVRQYTALVQVPRPRAIDSFDIVVAMDGTEEYRFYMLYQDIYINCDISSEMAIQGLAYLEVEYIFTDQELTVGEAPYECVAQRKGVFIYKKMRNSYSGIGSAGII